MTDITDTTVTQGWLFYDADCPRCVQAATRMARVLVPHGFHLVPLQTPGTPERLGVTLADLMTRMHLLTGDGSRFAGADAFVAIGRRLWWARPLVAVTALPGVIPLLRRTYDWVAAHRYCLGGSCQRPRRHHVWNWLPLALLPAAVFAVRRLMPDWVFMWTLALALFAGCKWLIYRDAISQGIRLTFRRKFGFLFGWVGMEPAAFAKERPAITPRPTEWFDALGRVALGAALIWGATRLTSPDLPLVTGWIGMLGITLVLHFGTFELLALGWRRAGIPVKPLMNAPFRATSIGDFWGARWNTGFHVLAHEYLFRPSVRRAGKVPATLGVFLISGLIHELVITIPARGGFGLPTAYFLSQGIGLIAERSDLGRRAGLGVGPCGRTFALIVTTAPVFWLFPPIFIHRIILPMLQGIGAL